MSALLFRRARALLALATALTGAAPLLAHDVWIEPGSYRPTPGQVVGLRLRVGQDLVGDPIPRIPALARQFVVEDARGRRPVGGRAGADPAGRLRVAAAGLHVVGYYSHPSAIELPADKFNAYLVEEGLDGVSALRAQRNETGASARELYSRCAKSLLLAGRPSLAQRDRALGFPLELVAERNPYLLRAGQQFPVRLIYQGQPLAGALVVAMNSLDPSDKQALRTDAAGRVRFRLRPGGMWLVKAVHMVAPAAGADADWESFWASLTFETRAGGAANGRAPGQGRAGT